MCGCKRSSTDRSSIRMGGDHMVSEVSTERFVIRARSIPLCVSEYVKMVSDGSPREIRNNDFDSG